MLGPSSGITLCVQAAILKQKYPSYWLPFLKAPYSLIYAVGPYFGLPRDLIKCALPPNCPTCQSAGNPLSASDAAIMQMTQCDRTK